MRLRDVRLSFHFMKIHGINGYLSFQHQCSAAKNGQTLTVGLLLLCLTGDYLLGQSGRGRVISIYNIHTKETLTVTYKRNGQYIPSALKKVNHVMRDWRRNESRVMRKDLIDLMWEVHNQLGSQNPFILSLVIAH